MSCYSNNYKILLKGLRDKRGIDRTENILEDVRDLHKIISDTQTLFTKHMITSKSPFIKLSQN